MTVLENEYLMLMPPEPSMAERTLDYCLRNRGFLKPFEPVQEEGFYTLEHQRLLLMAEAELWRQRRGFRFYVVPKAAPDLIIGSIGLSEVVWGAFLSCFLGYKLDERFLNRGYMTMCVSMVVDFAFRELGLHRVEANVMPRNGASLRVLEKAGFEREGISKKYMRINGVWEDHVHMVRLNDDL